MSIQKTELTQGIKAPSTEAAVANETPTLLRKSRALDLELKDILSLSFSAVALALSLILGYLQFFHERSEFSAVLAGVTPSADRVEYRLVLVNDGSESHAIVSCIALFGDGSSTSRILECSLDSAVVPANGMKVVDVSHPLPRIESADMIPGTYFVLRLWSIDSSGEGHLAGLVTSRMHIEKDKVVYHYEMGSYDLRGGEIGDYRLQNEVFSSNLVFGPIWQFREDIDSTADSAERQDSE